MELQRLLNAIRNVLEIGVEVNTQIVQKGNTTLTGISIGNNDVRPTVYMEHYEDVFQKEGYESVARKMIEVCKNAKLDININEVGTYEYAKEHLLLCIAPAGTNTGYVTIPYLDLELYFRVYVSDEGSYKVTEQMADSWGITKETLMEIALEKSEYVAQSMRDTIIGILKDDGMPEEYIIDMMPLEEPEQIVLTNKRNSFGASVIYSKEMLKEIADKYERDLYILPSSIHEVIVTVVDGVTMEDMSSMVREINETQVSPEEVLSNHAYIFRRDTMEIEW